MTAPPFEGRARESMRLRIAWIASLVGLFGWTIAWSILAEANGAAWVWAAEAGLAFLPGKYLIFVGLHPDAALGPWGIALLALGVDAFLALSLAVFLGWLLRFDWIARTLRAAHDRAEGVLETYPRLRRMAFWGVVLFVFLPLPASGAFGGTFVAQIVGLSRTRGVVAVCLGGATVSVVFASLATFLGAEAENLIRNPWITVASVLLFVGFAMLAWRHVKATLTR